MTHYLDLFSPETYEAYSRSDRTVSGFRRRQQGAAEKIHPGDRLLCYMTKVSRWVGILEVTSDCFIDTEPRFYEMEDPFVVRFRVKPLVWLPKEQTIPIHAPRVWQALSFTRDCDPGTSQWTGRLRCSLTKIDEADAEFLEHLLLAQQHHPRPYEFDEALYQRHVAQRVRRQGGAVSVTVPSDEHDHDEQLEPHAVRESHQVQARLATIGEAMGFSIWLPRNDRSAVLQHWQPVEDDVLLNVLPLNYDDVTLRTIEQIDVLWLRRRSIVRAFEVEHTTAVYSGILRMADLLALQPNMDIKLHIVAPPERREKVFQEVQRPVFSLLERAPLAECCTFIAYDSLEALAQQKHLAHLSDSVLDEYAEEAE